MTNTLSKIIFISTISMIYSFSSKVKAATHSVLYQNKSMAKSEAVNIRNDQLQLNFTVQELALESLSTNALELQKQSLNFNLATTLADTLQLKMNGEDKALPLSSNQSQIRLPLISKLFWLKPGDARIRLVKKNVLQFGGNYKLAPYLPKPCRCQDLLLPHFNLEMFKESGKQDQIRVEYLGDFQGRPLSKITFSPIDLSLNEDGTARLELSLETSLVIENSGSEGVSSLLVDFNQSKDMLVKGNENKKLIMVGPRELLQGLDTFISFKKSLGVEVSIVYLSNPLNKEVNQREIATAVKSAGAQYLVIVGSEEVVAPFFLPTQFSEETPSDLPYTTLGGEGDTIPDIFSSRLVATTSNEVRMQLEKSMEFERLLKNGQQSKQVIGVASDEGLNPSDKEYLEGMMNPLKNSLGANVTYFLQAERNVSTPENIVEALNRGAVWMNYIGHGSGDSWPSIGSRPMTLQDLNSLRTTKHRPFILDVACQNGRFNLNHRWGATLMGLEGRGARAYYGGSVDISWDPPAIMARAVSQYIEKEKRSGRQLTLGESLFQGQMALAEQYSDAEAHRQNRVWYHQQGDPTQLVP